MHAVDLFEQIKRMAHAKKAADYRRQRDNRTFLLEEPLSR
jgi:hypothetical protein